MTVKFSQCHNLTTPSSLNLKVESLTRPNLLLALNPQLKQPEQQDGAPSTELQFSVLLSKSYGVSSE